MTTLVITQVQYEAKDVGNTYDYIVLVYWDISDIHPTSKQLIVLLLSKNTAVFQTIHEIKSMQKYCVHDSSTLKLV